MEMTKNIELQTAEQNIEKLKKHKMEDAAICALSNEHEIIRLARRMEMVLSTLARDYDQMLGGFLDNGEISIYNVCNELPELKAQLRCRKEVRNLYAELLK